MSSEKQFAILSYIKIWLSMCYIGLNLTNTKDVHMRIFWDKDCEYILNGHWFLNTIFFSTLWFKKKPLFFFDMARQSIKIRLRGATESPQISKEKTSIGVRLQHTHWKKAFFKFRTYSKFSTTLNCLIWHFSLVFGLEPVFENGR